MSNFIFLGISNIGKDLPQEFVNVLLMVVLLAYVSLLFYSLTNKGKKRFSFKGIIRYTLIVLSYISLVLPVLVIEQLNLEAPPFFVMVLYVLIGVLLMVLIDNKLNLTRYTILFTFAYSSLISTIACSILPKEMINFEDCSSLQILNLVLERNTLDSTAQSNLCAHILNHEDNLTQAMWKEIVVSSTKYLDDSIESYTFDTRENIFMNYLQKTEGNNTNFDSNRLSIIVNKDDYFMREFIYKKYLFQMRESRELNH